MTDEPNYNFLDKRVKKIVKQRKKIDKLTKERDKNPNKEPYEKNLAIQKAKEELVFMNMSVKPKVLKT